MKLIQVVRKMRLLFFFILPLTFFSCRTNKKIVYFQDVPDSIYSKSKNITASQFSDPRIQSNDILQVSILTLDAAVNTMLNTDGAAAFSTQPGTGVSAAGQQPSGFLVDNNGDIELPIIGKISVKGLTTAQARDSIHKRVAMFYIDPVVNVKLSNFSVTVLGEVARPATYVVPNEKVGILDLIGMAGDLTIYGRRENILLVRDSIGHKQFVRFNLNSAAIINSPYYYLKQGDIVYVEPSKSKIQSIDTPRRNGNIALLISAATLVIAILTRL